ncbi:uncharacterized protein [Miscanthus floridulus]|uniref:uncharacterized protein n=1 Tax=Miscanthus floridulus TaxID=154761 RepID=UPI003457B7E0
MASRRAHSWWSRSSRRTSSCYANPVIHDTLLIASMVLVAGTTLVLHPWTCLAHAEAASMQFKASLELEGIPPHAWGKDTIAKILAPSCWVHQVNLMSASKAEIHPQVLNTRPTLEWADYFLTVKDRSGQTAGDRVLSEFWRLFQVKREDQQEADRVLENYVRKRVKDMMKSGMKNVDDTGRPGAISSRKAQNIVDEYTAKSQAAHPEGLEQQELDGYYTEGEDTEEDTKEDMNEEDMYEVDEEDRDEEDINDNNDFCDLGYIW